MKERILELDGVSKNFTLESRREIKVLENIHVMLSEDETVALLGPSGSGKSTCLRLMCGLQQPTSGRVLRRGQPLVGYNTDVSLVFQSFALFPWESVYSNIEIALRPLNLDAHEMHQRIKRVIDLVGLEGFEEAYPRELSGGMKQRVGVARALAMNRPVLFLDEPFSALDVLTADTLRKEIVKIYQNRMTLTRSMVVVTHNIQEAVFMADRILVLGSHPGHIRAEFVNPLPYPRDEESPAFHELVTQIHRVITETYMPDTPAVSPATPARAPRPEILPDVPITDIIGIVEAVHAEGDVVDIFALSEMTGADFGQTLYLVKAAELLDLVDTPKQAVALTKDGHEFAHADINQRKRMIHAAFARLVIVQHTVELLRQSEIARLPVRELITRVHQWIPNEDPERIVETIIDWGRFAEFFGYNDDTKTIYLDVGQEVR